MLSAAGPNEFRILRQSLLPYRAALAPEMWRLVDSPRQDAGQRLRAAGALALFDAKSPRWSDLGDTVVAMLLEGTCWS